ncbi:SDR family NAD(P)-dependent oxidoreductase [Streptomyces gilvus]|uniref:SDR family NAD(P)-dependent oxidoreductase n=1 Tax=Streptomyces gilvus TaxID=2920937 RepID=UPI001F0D8406|nr:SDR family oxidoreductase [Streptomyces sp. CME 23]MCH5675648.1 SDR family oxidoreductase [Streptomyces sp. CME 23]
MRNVNREGAAGIPWAELHSFRDRVAIVTGGGSGIGRAAVARLGEAGAKVVVVDIDAEAAELVAKTLPEGSAVSVGADVATESGTRAYADAALSAFGRIDLFFSNAGILGEAGPLLDMSVESWERTMRVNLLGTFLGLQEVARRMVAQGEGGAIVATASIAALRSSPGASVYAASKAGVVNLVRGAAKEWGPHGIRVNAICPAPTLTNFARPSPEQEEVMRSRIPLGRFAEADDMARVALWLLSDGACYVNGAVLPVDGGHEA